VRRLTAAPGEVDGASGEGIGEQHASRRV
jgi:hypothetical protein